MRPFKLQSVLDYRKRIEKMVQKSLLSCIEEKNLLIAEKQTGQKEILRLGKELQKKKQKNISMPEVMLFENCIQCKKKCMNDITCKIEMLNLEINRKKEELIKARQEKMVLAILREKWQNEEKKKQRQAENVFLDECVILGFGGNDEIE